MTSSPEMARYWEALLNAYPRRVRFELVHLLEAYKIAFPYRDGDVNTRTELAALLSQLSQAGLLQLPQRSNGRAYDHAERTALPRYVTRISQPASLDKPTKYWRPELAFAAEMPQGWHRDLELIQNWLRDGGTSAGPVALRERSAEIFDDEKRLDALLGTQLFSPGRVTLELLRCYLPTIPIYLTTIPLDEERRPLLVVENHTTFDTLQRWNEQQKRYSAIAFGAGTGFVSSCKSLSTYSNVPGCSGVVLYFGDVDPKGLWIPVRATEQCGMPVLPDERLYSLLFAKARKTTLTPRDPLGFDLSLLQWLPANFRHEAEQYFQTGRRLPQELVSIYDLL